jgi:(p)ppGpp synthase/HD superfamily hydrolase
MSYYILGGMVNKIDDQYKEFHFSSILENYDIIQKALIVSYYIHKNQFRKKSKTPYFVHLLDVAKYLFYETDNKDIICAGLLHDSLEDTDYPRELLKKEFGERVYNLVEFMTEPENDKTKSKMDLMSTWRFRKEHSINKLDSASDDEALVFLADKLSNLLSMKEDIIDGVDLWSKFNAPKEEIKWYYTSIRDKLSERFKEKRIFKIFSDLVDSVF